ncbi:MAG: hypothetical protein H7Y60_12210 [Rhodospirillaceae bacterium]|nr:hypothetical protein [Rhodospirillales bacterium]
MNAVENRVRAEQIQVLARNLPFTTITGTALDTALAECFRAVEDAVASGDFSGARIGLEQAVAQLVLFTEFLAGLHTQEGA